MVIKRKIKFLCILTALLCGCAAASPVQKELFLLDTYAGITALSGGEKALSAAEETAHGLDAVFSAAYGANANTLTDEALTECAAEAFAMSEKYGGSVNIACGAVTDLWGISTESPRVPEDSEIKAALKNVPEPKMPEGGLGGFGDGVMLDFGAVAKGYVCDRIYDRLSAEYPESCVITSFGSSILFYGSKPDGSQFTAAVKDPLAPEQYLGILRTDSGFVSTSGGYERYFEENGVRYDHIISAESGYPVETDLLSVTVIVNHDTENGGILSDFLATEIYAEGTAGLEKYLNDTDYGIIAVDENKNVYISKGVDFTLENTGYRQAENSLAP
ncbi:MAG: FAD:protein FMN transferase [Oscillospiraceae bacterium]